MKRMGGLQGIMGMLPGVAKMKGQMAESGIDDRMILRQEAIISSMTKAERKKPDLLNASRKKRIAAGAGMDVAELNKLLKMQKQMADTMKKLGKMGKGGMLKQAMRAMTGKGGGLPDLAAALAEGRVLPPIDHPDPAHLLVTGTGLTHLGSAATRDASCACWRTMSAIRAPWPRP